MDRANRRLYIESDGRIFLIERDGWLDLPSEDEAPFDVETIARLVPDDTWFCVPKIGRHPHEWYHKDQLAALPVTERVRDAVHSTMPRVVVEGLCCRDGRILLVKGNRGLTDGIWTLPGGFLRFGETPEACVLREIREEVGMEASILGLASVQAKLGKRSRLHWTVLFYRVHSAGEPSPDPDEIAEARFVPIREAADLIQDATMTRAIIALLEEEFPSG